ncbi:MAG: hypothetical protein HFH74_01820 [Lachnospiraceae bacterium]|jgi:hypothetical protein|nr:hypothetical protein [Lachnospiraceae bacterium]
MITENKIRKVITILLCVGILSLSIWLLLSPKKNFSENENRYLTKFPVLSAKNLLDGTYTESLSDWLADHFPQRDFFVGLKSQTEILSGRKEIDHIYVAKEDYLIEQYAQPQNTQRIIDTLTRFYEKVSQAEVNINLMLVPTAVTIHKDLLPQNAPASNQLETAQSIYTATEIPKIDCTDCLFTGVSEGQLYYRTDHHWTTLGAYYGYLAFCAAKNLQPVSLTSLQKQTVTEDFAGTLYSKVNDYNHKKDSITVYTNPEDHLTVTYTDTGEVSDSLYNFDYLTEKDKYSLFLNNIHSLIEIENQTSSSEDVLMLIKDSYANSIVPFLAHHYRKIYVFDTRYYKDGPSSFLSEHKEINDILLLYNMNTLDTDSGIRGIY